jgi:hypothetical protein
MLHGKEGNNRKCRICILSVSKDGKGQDALYYKDTKSILAFAILFLVIISGTIYIRQQKATEDKPC